MRRAHGRTAVALGTTVTVRVVSDVPTPDGERRVTDAIIEALREALGWCHAVEACCSRFDPSSELMRLCARPGPPVHASDMLFAALSFACEVARLTDGAFDPGAGDRVHDLGFDRHHATGERARLAGRGGSWRDIHCDPATRTITLARPLQLDLGAVAKGMAVDLAMQSLAGFTGAMVDAGGDVRVRGHNEEGTPWRVGILHPANRGEVLHVVEATDAAVCTSGLYERGQHLVDARTGAPAHALASVTVRAPTAMAADSLGTAAFVLGPDHGRALLESQGVEGWFVDPTGRMTHVPGTTSDLRLTTSEPGEVSS